MGQALYRNYRPKSFKDVVGQEHITTTLQNAIKAGRLSHAYLFTGPKGVGKTSVARILAHEVNSLNYTDESIDLDIIEIDAASNRRIDEIRDLRDKVNIAPVSAKYKVYIIDEVHMLTREAFNALLKTLEEPPAHCIFILATTEAHKLPETIISRTQRFEFKAVPPARSAEHLAHIAKQEKIRIAPDALSLLAEFGKGSFRDSIGYLDQLSSLGKAVEAADVRRVLGLPEAEAIDRILEAVTSANSSGLMEIILDIESQGVGPAALAAGLAASLRRSALENHIQPWQIGLLKQLTQVSANSRPQELLEIILLEAASGFHPAAASGTAKLQANPGVKAAAPLEPKPKPAASSEFDISLWPEVIERSKKQAASIYTALRLAEASFSGGVLSLAFQFPLHQKKLGQAKNKQMVSQLVEEVSGQQVEVDSVLRQMPGSPSAPEVRPDVSIISNIFGGAEVQEA